MKNLGDIRHSMRAIGETKQITSAMRLISISKMQKAISRYEANQLHFNRVQAAMKDILLHSPEVRHSFLQEKRKGVPAYIVIAADKGLCGGYNHNVLNFAKEIIDQDENKIVLTVGQEARVFFQRQKVDVDIEYMHIAQDPSLHSARRLANELAHLYKTSGINKLNIIYTKFISTFKQEPTMLELLPITMEHFENVEIELKYAADMVFVPSAKQVFDVMVPQYILGLVYGCLVQAYASEHCARMMAMESATKSADEMLSQLSIEMNRARQYAITSEISEIVAAMEALD